MGLPEYKLPALETLHIEVKSLHENCKTASYAKLDMQAKTIKETRSRRRRRNCQVPPPEQRQDAGQRAEGASHPDLR
ncbi:MAG: hypothetical protein LBD58_04050 [Treponema sp.]|nr:hypothetical protein [Treponema sp.]